MKKERPFIYPAQNEVQSLGQLTVHVRTSVGYKPIDNATVAISETGLQDQPIEILGTDISGQTLTIELPAPPYDYSQEPDSPKPYSEYNISVKAEGFEPIMIEGAQILPRSLAIQDTEMVPSVEVSSLQREVIVISAHTLYGEYPAKLPEDELKKDVEEDFIVLPSVVVPSMVVVHDGVPDDATAINYFVPFKDYIKNVASSEIYSTWPESTIQANVLAIISFTLNRVYTEWYRGKGYDFTITSSTAFDQKFIFGRNFYKTISDAVDALFINYLSRPGIKQPLLSQYCDGSRVICPKWLSQWGSRELGEQGLSTINILRNYYGSNLYLGTAEKVSGIPASFPGQNLQLGSRGAAVRTIQEQLNAISNNFPAIPKGRVDGVYGTQTKETVEKFQEVFNMPITGIVDYPTWYKISDIFVAVKRLAELV